MPELQIVISENALAWSAGVAAAPVAAIIGWLTGRRREEAQITQTAEDRLWERMVQYIGLVEANCAKEQTRLEKRLDECEERVASRLEALGGEGK